ncbi:MAG: outer membrane protein assembly factor BamD [Pseudomonadota bacterium]|nr:outer membrane protein assembly factor BamD [Pseudomonadota bacterium]
MIFNGCGKSSARQRFFVFQPLFAVLLLMILLFGASCASRERIPDNPKSLFQEAEQAYQKKSYSRANELFQSLQNEFPDSDYAKLALLRTADISYCLKELEDAARTYNDFLNFNENHDKAPYALYQVGMTYYVTLKTLDLDLEALRQALEVFQEALARYPDSPPYTAKIIQRINDCKRRFAKREFYVGFYYYKRGKFHSAIGRFEYLLKNYPGFIDDKVLYYLGLAYLNRGDVDEGHKALLTLTKAFPASSFTAQARPWLEKDEGPGLPLLFMARDYFLVKDYDISDHYLTTTFMPEKFSPRLFNLLKGQKSGGEEAEEVTFSSLYRPVSPAKAKAGSKTEVPPTLKSGPSGSPQAALESSPGAKTGKSEALSPAVLEPRQQASLGRQDDPLEIISDWTEADRQSGTISFGGRVIAKQKDMVLYADKVVNYFDTQSQKLIKAIAVGNVKLNQADKFVTCERAELIQAERKVTLTGNPVMWQGENRVTGERIVIYLNASQAEVFGGKKGKAKVKILQTK